MIAALQGMDVYIDTGADGAPRQRVVLSFVNAGAFMPTDELQILAGVGAIVAVQIMPTSAAAALPSTLENPSGGE